MTQRALLSGYSGTADDLQLVQVSPDGHFQRLSSIHHGQNPSFCCRLGTTIYAAAELPQGASVTAYTLQGDTLRPLRQLELPGMRGLCHLTCIQGVLYGACYESGHFLAVDAELSQLLWSFQPTGTPHAHWTQGTADALYMADLGNDCLYRFVLRHGLPASAPVALTFPAGSGPRQPLPLPDGGCAVVCEVDGMLRFLHADGSSSTALLASHTNVPNALGGACRLENTLFVGNRGPNTVSAFHLAPAGVSLIGEWPTGNWPRHLSTLGENLLLTACSRDDSVWLYRWDGQQLSPLDRLHMHQAACVLPIP